MAGGLLQLVAYGAQDLYLTGSAKVTFFQAVYRRHTNFSMETIEQVSNGSATNGGRVSVTMARNGDLVGETFLEMEVKANLLSTSDNNGFSTEWVAERAISEVEFTCGGQRIDKHYQRWWRLYSEIFLDEAKRQNYGRMTSANSGGNTSKVYLPLLFYWNRNPGLYLPLIALQYHEIRLEFTLGANYLSYFEAKVPRVFANYVYLDTDERRRMAQKGHEFLIEQVQHTGVESLTEGTATAGNKGTFRLSLNHPVKALYWTLSNTDSGEKNGLWNMTSEAALNVTVNSTSGSLNGAAGGCPVASGSQAIEGGVNSGNLKSFKLMLNGQDRMKEADGKYYNQVQPFYYHAGNPMAGHYMYSFALKPGELQPSGTCNFSRIDNAQVDVSSITGGAAVGRYLSLYAVNYNIFRCQSGMGGLNQGSNSLNQVQKVAVKSVC